jgi:uncharacterized membrane protein YcaP (DUF421 family)
MFFSSWEGLLRIVVIGCLGYLTIVLFLRLSGNRTLSKMNSFDFIITIALGSTFATAILDKKTALLDAVLTFGLLIGLQYIVTYLSVKYPAFERFVKASPVLLYHKGEFIRENMKQVHVTEAEVKSGIRQEGIADIAAVESVILENNGKISVTRKVS